jgi:hypothetical protein
MAQNVPPPPPVVTEIMEGDAEFYIDINCEISHEDIIMLVHNWFNRRHPDAVTYRRKQITKEEYDIIKIREVQLDKYIVLTTPNKQDAYMQIKYIISKEQIFSNMKLFMDFDIMSKSKFLKHKINVYDETNGYKLYLHSGGDAYLLEEKTGGHVSKLHDNTFKYINIIVLNDISSFMKIYKAFIFHEGNNGSTYIVSRLISNTVKRINSIDKQSQMVNDILKNDVIKDLCNIINQYNIDTEMHLEFKNTEHDHEGKLDAILHKVVI